MPPDSPSASETPASDVPRPTDEWRVLDQLRRRVEAAADEVERLRAENQALSERVQTLETAARNATAEPTYSFAFDTEEDPAVLKSRVRGFIDAIDEILRARPEPASLPPSSTTADDRHE